MTNGEKIRELRKRAGMKRVELAERLDVTRSCISQIENGLSSASDNLLNTSEVIPSLLSSEKTLNSDSCLVQELAKIKQRLNAIGTLLIQVLARLNN